MGFTQVSYIKRWTENSNDCELTLREEIVQLGKETGVSVVLPAFNESPIIGGIIKEIDFVLKDMKHEIVVVDDGSCDFTGDVATEAGANLVIVNEHNVGYGESLKKGIENSRYDTVVVIDADGTFDPAEIPRLIKPIVDGSSDMVVGSRFVAGGHIRPSSMTLANKIGYRLLEVLSRLLFGRTISDITSNFRAYRRSSLGRLHLQQKGVGIGTEILVKAMNNHFSVKEVPVTFRPRIGAIVNSTRALKTLLQIYAMIFRG